MTELQALADRIAIDDLITRYTVAVDTGDWDRLDEVFTPDAHIDYTATGGTSGSFPEVKRWLAETLPMFTRLQHYVTQKDVRVDGDEARVAAYFYNPMAIDNADGSSFFLEVGGIYHHELVRTAAGWRSRHLHEQLVWDRRSS
jgi:ketosteroid isomerase-like protein